MPRTGRPLKADSLKKNNYKLRLSDDELQMLEECSEELGIPKSEVIIKGINLIYQQLNGKK